MTIKNNNKLKIVVASLIVIGCSDLAYVRYGQFKDNELKIGQFLNQTEKKLPKGMIQKYEINHHAWVTDGIYSLQYQKDMALVTINYKIKHNLWSYVTGNMEVEATTTLTGSVFKDIKMADVFMKTNGTIFRDGSISLFNQGESFSYSKDGNEIKIKPYNITMDYNNRTNDIKNQLFVSAVEVNMKNNKAQIEHIDVKHNMNINNIMLNDFSLNINNITNNTIKVNNVSLVSKSQLSNNKYNITNKISINSVQTGEVKQIDQFDIGYAVIGLDKTATDNMIVLSQKINNETVSSTQADNNAINSVLERNKKLLKDNESLLVQKGFAINVTPFKVKGNFGFVDLDANLIINPVKDIPSIALVDQTKFTLKATGKGSFVPMVKMYVGLPNNPNGDNTELKTNIIVEKGVLTIDGEVVENAFLKTMTDNQIKSETSLNN